MKKVAWKDKQLVDHWVEQMGEWTVGQTVAHWVALSVGNLARRWVERSE